MRNFSLTGFLSLIFIYVDDIFVCFSSRNEALSSFHCLKDLHPSLIFTMDEEKDKKLQFLGVLVEPRSFAFVTCIYRKPPFTGFYWDAFAAQFRKVNLTKCLTFRALKICSDNKIKSEFEQIYFGYLEEVIDHTINKTVNMFMNNVRPLGPSKCPVYVRFPWIGSFSQLIADIFSCSVSCCYNASMVQTIFTTWAAIHSIHMDVLPISQQSNSIYKFQCCCNATYIGRTSKRLEVRVKQYVPRDIRDQTSLGRPKYLDSIECLKYLCG